MIGNVILLGDAPPPRRKDPSAYKPQPGRDGPDFWPTIDPGLHDMLLHCVLPKLPVGCTLWEAAAGAGHLVDLLRRARREVVASDLLPQRPDIVPHDFLRGAPPKMTAGTVMITNPPNSRLTEFLAHGLALIDLGHLEGMALLTRLGADTTKGRGAGFNRAAYEWRTCWRPYWKPRCKGDKQPRWTAQWTLWRRGISGPPMAQCLTYEEIVAPRLF